MANKKLHWKLLGEVGVDAGCLMIADPCYVVGKDSEINKAKPEGWTQFCRDHFRYTPGESDIGQVNYARGHAGLGVVARTSYGDVTYSVYGLFDSIEPGASPLAMLVLTDDVKKLPQIE